MNKTWRVVIATAVALALLAGGFGGGFVVGSIYAAQDTPSFVSTPLPSGHPPVLDNQETGQPPAAADDMDALFAPFWEAWDLLHQYYVDQPLDDVTLMRGAIRGMMESLGDPHTGYMDPIEYEDATTQLSGEYEGIGAWVDTSGDYLTIVTPMKGSPAEQAGLKPGDMIIAIDGEDMTGVPPETARQKVLGPAGTEVVLTVLREGQEEPLEITVTRAKITVPSVEYEMLPEGIAYVRLNTFGDTTGAELRAALDELLAQNPKGVILDLRNNGGGYLTTAVDVASQFLSSGVVLYEQYGDGSRDVYKVRRGGLATDLPLVVLVNEGTASASEIVAGAIQDYERGTLVGVVTYGKGSVQNWIPLENDGAVRITVARWLTPNERTIDRQGLTPDVIVEITEDDYANDRDPQLDKAIEILLQTQP